MNLYFTAALAVTLAKIVVPNPNKSIQIKVNWATGDPENINR